ncbi:hypothetical protein SSX86_004653 [Deinandra increscens subsp. villosa]|uniref:Protodermal factor 1 n=1 Tax=Deinandra increscens subsp. villosa TaxID=3103831 RepID=A0AAP0H7S7_9ASTR
MESNKWDRKCILQNINYPFSLTHNSKSIFYINPPKPFLPHYHPSLHSLFQELNLSMAKSTPNYTTCLLLVWGLVAALISHASSSKFQDQKNFYFPPIGVGYPPIGVGYPPISGGYPPIDPGVGSPPVIQTPPIVPSPPIGYSSSPPPTHGGSGGSTPPAHHTPPVHHTPSHGGSGGGSHGGGGHHHQGGSPPANCGNPSPHTPVDPRSPPHHTPSPPTYHYTPPAGGGGTPSSPPTYHYTPPAGGGGTPSLPPIVLPPTTPGIPLVPSPPFDPNSPPSPIGGTCDYWRNHPAVIWGLFGWWGTTIGSAFGVTSLPATGSHLNLVQALSNTRTDGIGALYREGTASLLNSIVNKNFPYSTSHVKDSFAAAIGSNKAAAAQARVFKLANEVI